MLPASTPISTAAQHLLENRLTFALVTDDEDSSMPVVGMATERSMLQYAMCAGDLAFFSSHDNEPTVADWMIPKTSMLSVRLDDPLLDAASLLLNEGIYRKLPVLDYWGKLHSLLDVRDVVLELVGREAGLAAWKGKLVADALAAKRRKRLEESPMTSVDLSGRKIPWHEQLAEYLLEHHRRSTITSHQPVEVAARQMLKQSLTFLVVIQPGATPSEDRVVGLVNERSFLSYCARGISEHAPAGPASAPLQQTVMSVATPLESVLHVSLTDPVGVVISKFFQYNVRHLPVIERGRLMGIISARDLLGPLLPS